MLSFSAEPGRYDPLFLSGWVNQVVKERLQRVEGVESVSLFGGSPLAFRLWLDPTALLERQLTIDDVRQALEAQNVLAALGQTGEAPVPADQVTSLPLQMEGRLRSPSELEQLVLGRGPDGGVVLLRDIGRVSLGSESYDTVATDLSGHPSVALALYQRVLDGVGRPLPVIELALRWGRERRPRSPRLAVVHGDFRTGNVIVGPEGLRAVLDWEVAHLGDPMEDLGYLCMRTWRFGGAGPVGGFGQRAELFAAYQAASGQPVDPEAVRFWEVMGSVRWALGCVRRARSFRHQARRRLEFAAVGRRFAEPAWDILDLIEGREV